MKFNIKKYKPYFRSSISIRTGDGRKRADGHAYTDIGIVEVYSEVADSGFKTLELSTFYKGLRYFHYSKDATLSLPHLSRLARQFAAEVVRAAGEAGR